MHQVISTVTDLIIVVTRLLRRDVDKLVITAQETIEEVKLFLFLFLFYIDYIILRIILYIKPLGYSAIALYI